MHDFTGDKRIVLTLDAGGTNFVFSALKGLKEVTKPFTLNSNAHDLKACIKSLQDGFTRLIDGLEEKPVAISFAFPGPADYQKGIIGNLPNLPAFKGGGVPLGPILEEKFQIPVFINNDGNLFALGEAIGGFLPYVNDLLKKSGSEKQYKNLIGITLGTGYGGGIVVNGEPVIGDNSNAGEVWILRNKLYPEANTEESIGIGAVIARYLKYSEYLHKEDPDPKGIYEIALGEREGDVKAALKTYSELAEVTGDSLATLVNIIDAPVVIGGGIASAFSLFGETMINEMNSIFLNSNGRQFPRMACRAFEVESHEGIEKFSKDQSVEVKVNDNKSVVYDPVKKIAVGLSKLGTSKAISAGAYAVALQNLPLTDE